jgi:hypothetical protein
LFLVFDTRCNGRFRFSVVVRKVERCSAIVGCGEFLHFRSGHRGAGSGGETCRKGGAEKRGENVTAQRAAETENGHRRQLE